MKSKATIFAVAMLALSLLAGCAAKTPEPPATTQSRLQTTAPVSVTGAPEAEVPATEPLLQTTAATENTYEPIITPVTTQPQTQVTVTNADEFLAAIAPDTEILLDAPLIDLSLAEGYGETDGEYYYWHEEYDGPGLYIKNVSNLTIRGAGENHDANVISSDPRYAYVLTFENCSGIYTVGFTAGHSKQPGSCAGGVLAFRNSQDILVEDCGLFGCGTIGVQGDSSKNLQVFRCDIYECSVGGVELYNCDDVRVDSTTFRDLGTPEFEGQEFRVYGCGSVTCDGVSVHDGMPRQ